MHSTLVRVQNVFGFFTTVAFVVGLFTALSVLLYPPSPIATVDVASVKVIKGRPQYYSSRQQEYAFITFDLDADLESLYNWNTKQVFCWLNVVYGGGRGSKHVSERAPTFLPRTPVNEAPHSPITKR
jgi:signal peptidase complex subunit 3